MFARETIKFLIPTDIRSLNSSIGRRVVPLYINPATIQIQHQKNISDTQTIGGFIIQYWGDRITTLTLNGTTGSGGIEAINILYSIYKSEQIEFQRLLVSRQAEYKKKIEEAQKEAESNGPTNALSALDEVLFDGQLTDTWNGVGEVMDFFKGQISNAGFEDEREKKISLLPTLSAFAVSLEMYFQGRIYRGYIDSMSITENASSPGLFDYMIQFKSLKEFGERNNFMPWHTNPRDEQGNPKQKPTVGSSTGDYNLSFPFDSAKKTVKTANSVSRVIDDQVGTSNENNNIDQFLRFNKVRSK